MVRVIRSMVVAATALALGAGAFAEDAENDDGTQTVVIVQTGQVQVTNENGEVVVNEGGEAQATNGGAPMMNGQATVQGFVTINGQTIAIDPANAGGFAIGLGPDGDLTQLLGGLKVKTGENGKPQVLMNGKPLAMGPAVMGGGDVKMDGPLGEPTVRDTMRRASRLLGGLDTDQIRTVLDWVDEVDTGRALAGLNTLLKDRDEIDDAADKKLQKLVAQVKRGVEATDARRLKSLAEKTDDEETLASLQTLVRRMHETFQKEKAEDLGERASEIKKMLDSARGGFDARGMMQNVFKNKDFQKLMRGVHEHGVGTDVDAEKDRVVPDEKEAPIF